MATPYNFVTPIRYFKSNDPYYYEVDNLPLRQLEENILYVKQKVEEKVVVKGGPHTDPGHEVSIYNIKELRPKVIDNAGRLLQVNAGRFLGRVNDAFDTSKPLALISRDMDELPQMPNILPVLSQVLWTKEHNAKVFADFVGTTAADKAYNTNGLESFYTFYSTPMGTLENLGRGEFGQGQGSSWGVDDHKDKGGDYPWYGPTGGKRGAQYGLTGHYKNLWPSVQGNWNKYVAANPFITDNAAHTWYDTQTWPNGMGLAAPSLHVLFTQMWRGVFRTVVVDFPDTTIQIPKWRPSYYYTLKPKGHNYDLIEEATQRIDLLFAFSIPIDASSTTVADWQQNISKNKISDGKFPPTQLTQPALGLIVGAGVAILKSDLRHPLHENPIGIAGLEAGGAAPHKGVVTRKMLLCPSDQEPLANQGITDITGEKIHGSFPSPDDLVNIAPVLALDVEGNDKLALVGQSALPIAYIITRKDQETIEAKDIIDIRPFLRTTEFTYNERAGIAAANPPLSFANPAVGAFQLQNMVNAIVDKLPESAGGGGGGQGGGGGGGSTPLAQPLYTDYIMGGLAYGVEGTMLTMCDGSVQNTDDPFGTRTTTTTKFISQAPGNPDFDFSWAKSSKAFMEKGVLRDKQALLEYFYRMRQSDLKGWLANPNLTINPGGGRRSDTYLGLPGGDQSRRIPLYPEWDMPIDSNNYKTVVTGQSLASPPETWWMWIEGQSVDRPLVYGPGSLLLNVGGSQYGYLNSRLGLGWGRNPNSTLGRGTVVSVSKSIDVSFPQWVEDYDVVADYVNCSPVTMAMPSLGAKGQMTNENTAGQYGMGAGISVNKSTIEGNRATITINSVASPYPEGVDGILTNAGMIGDTSGPLNGPGSNVPQRASAPTLTGASFQWLAYTVCLPQFSQQKFNCMRQNEGRSQTITRSTPKFGAAIYPTVKFTIIGYPDRPVSRNTRYNSTSHWGLIQDVSQGDRGVLINSLPPLGGRASIDIGGTGEE